MKWLVLLVVLVALGFLSYKFYFKPKVLDRSMDNGDIVSSDLMTGAQKARFEKENAGEDADGQSERKTTHGNIPADGATLTATPATGQPAAQTAASAVATAPAAQATPVYPASPASTTMPASNAAILSGLGAPPASDSMPANLPNNVHLGGSGTYQWYRQGNITYRVDTVTGRSCVAFATMEEWRKSIVLSHGCGGNA